MWRGLEVAGTNPANAEEQIGLLPFEKYAGGKPKLGEFILHAYASESALEGVCQWSADGCGWTDVAIKKPIKEQQTHSLVLTAGTYVFFKTTSGVLSDAKVRQALVAASNPAPIIASLGYTTRPVTGPLLKGQLGQDAKYDKPLMIQKRLKNCLMRLVGSLIPKITSCARMASNCDLAW